jgi:hypothetical protein
MTIRSLRAARGSDASKMPLAVRRSISESLVPG